MRLSQDLVSVWRRAQVFLCCFSFHTGYSQQGLKLSFSGADTTVLLQTVQGITQKIHWFKR